MLAESRIRGARVLVRGALPLVFGVTLHSHMQYKTHKTYVMRPMDHVRSSLENPICNSDCMENPHRSGLGGTGIRGDRKFRGKAKKVTAAAAAAEDVNFRNSPEY